MGIFNAKNTIAFTGNRTLSHSRMAVKNTVKSLIIDYCNIGYTNYICGMAVGFDLLCGEVVLELQEEGYDVKLYVALPYLTHGDNFSLQDKKRHAFIMSKATGVFTIQTHQSNWAYHSRNDFLISNCSKFLCYLNSSSGGTYSTVKKAMKKGISIIDARPQI